MRKRSLRQDPSSGVLRFPVTRSGVGFHASLTWIVPAVLPLAMLFPTPAAAQVPQDSEAAAQIRRAQIEAEQMREIQESSRRALQDLMNDTPQRRADSAREQQRRRQERYREFKETLREFQTAKAELAQALDARTPPKESAKKIEKNSKIFLKFIKATNKQHLHFDSSELDGLTDSELGWEALTTAERVTPGLTDVILNENQPAVDIDYLLSLPHLEWELQRLRWIANQLK